MQTVTAVVTTGIYCRPGCEGRPRRENKRTYPSAAAAEANGYRACLRCRPYRAPLSPPWTGPELVCRAVRLILAGALDEGREGDLAARLGVSPRHLRRLFATHAGVTPDGLARSARAHFARRLLDDTDLPITEIAYAAGFGSLRQFNRVCQEVFRSSPRELRGRRRSTDRLIADGGLALRLPFRGPLDWDAMLDHFADHAIPGVEAVAGRAYRRTVVINQDPGVLELLPGGPDHLVLRAHLPHWEGLIHVVDRARRIANLDLDPSEPVACLAGDALIGSLLRADPGVRPPGTWDPFETGIRAIIGQQLSGPAANTVMSRLVERFGRAVAGLGALGLRRIFPSPAALAGVELSGLGLAAAPARAVRCYARALVDQELRLDRSLPLERLVSAIRRIDGVTAQTAHYIALRLGEPDAWPISERTLEVVTGAGASTAPRLVDRWRPWRAVVAAHLWRSPAPAPKRAPAPARIPARIPARAGTA